MRRNSLRQRPLEIEVLERRTLLDGNVEARLDRAGNLIIEGDALDNCVLIEQSGPDISVQGCDFTPLPTTINGAPGPFIAAGLTGDLRVRLKAGDDNVVIGLFDMVHIPGGVSIESGKGNDFVGLGPVDIGGSLAVNTSDGDDDVELGNIFGSVPSRVAGETRIKAGKGDDIVRVAGLDTRGNFSISASEGDDKVILGDDVLEFLDGAISPTPTQIGRRASVETGGGNDTISLAEVDIGGELRIDTGKGTDRLVLVTSSAPGPSAHVAGETQIESSGGNIVLIEFAIFDKKFTSDLGNGTDALVVLGSIFNGDFRVHGGKGTDTLADCFNIFGGARVVKSFEIVNFVEFPGPDELFGTGSVQNSANCFGEPDVGD